MTVINQSPRTAEFLLSEATGSRSREQITLAATDAALPAGTVLGKVTASGNYAAYDPEAEDGSEAAAGVLYAAAPVSEAPQSAVGIVRDAEVDGEQLSGSDAAAVAALGSLGVIVR
ncbi:head decoration protein [Pseudomonas saudiphocaensis]|uniref:head decoration protein n=1 Tax=Pseudomonas saudiphocaensis TaxID=1499686 RepID=UPI000F7B4064|nr:head decoration protein [Pseudomonas saudiphocaensis]RRV18121.1 head decoration protein [Pseudomonas saudiphocaensis]